MIQSGKFDSLKMDIKKLANTVLFFTIKRLIEILGILISFIGIFLFISFITYSPDDPNFIFPENSANRLVAKLMKKLAVFLISIYMNQLYHFVSSNFYC